MLCCAKSLRPFICKEIFNSWFGLCNLSLAFHFFVHTLFNNFLIYWNPFLKSTFGNKIPMSNTTRCPVELCIDSGQFDWRNNSSIRCIKPIYYKGKMFLWRYDAVN